MVNFVSMDTGMKGCVRNSIRHSKKKIRIRYYGLRVKKDMNYINGHDAKRRLYLLAETDFNEKTSCKRLERYADYSSACLMDYRMIFPDYG
jgi:hypothetical protein